MLTPFFRRAAQLEYDEAALWYERRRFGLGVEFAIAIDQALTRACAGPQRFPTIVGDVRCVRVRRFPYAIFYRTRGEQLIVIAVFHARRDPAILRERSRPAE